MHDKLIVHQVNQYRLKYILYLFTYAFVPPQKKKKETDSKFIKFPTLLITHIIIMYSLIHKSVINIHILYFTLR